MRGHSKIIEMRKDGQAPKFIFINDYPCKTDWFENCDHATVCVSGDALYNLDLRFVVGLRVSISASTEGRARVIMEMAKEAGAITVGAGVTAPGVPLWTQSGWSDIWHKGGENA